LITVVRLNMGLYRMIIEEKRDDSHQSKRNRMT
jgi:hypothetical protein